MHERRTTDLIGLDAMMPCIVDLYKPIKQTDPGHRGIDTNLILSENEPDRTCDERSHKKTYLEGIVFLGDLQEHVVL